MLTKSTLRLSRFFAVQTSQQMVAAAAPLTSATDSTLLQFSSLPPSQEHNINESQRQRLLATEIPRYYHNRCLCYDHLYQQEQLHDADLQQLPRNSNTFSNWFTKLALLLGVIFLNSSSARCENDTDDDSSFFVSSSGGKFDITMMSPEEWSASKSDTTSGKGKSNRKSDCCDKSSKSSCYDDTSKSNASHEAPESSSLEEVHTSEGDEEEQNDKRQNVISGESTVPVVLLAADKQWNDETLKAAIKRTSEILGKMAMLNGIPGAVAAVTIDGEKVLSAAYGVCNIEDDTRCYTDQKYRIASISKPLTATMAMALHEDGLLDLDKPIKEYLPEWPVKRVNGKEVHITSRHLLSHTSGIRHYNLKRPQLSNKIPEIAKNTSVATSPKYPTNPCHTDSRQVDLSEFSSVLNSISEAGKSNSNSDKNYLDQISKKRKSLAPYLNHQIFNEHKRKMQSVVGNESDLFEYYINQPCTSTKQAVDLFKDDELFFEPGTDFLYTSHGYTLLSRVLEAVTGMKFEQLAKQYFREMALDATTLDVPGDIIPDRLHGYHFDQNKRLRNAPYVNNSYKWAGGGFLSTVHDLTLFGNTLLYSLQTTPHRIEKHAAVPGYLKSSTVKQMWSPHFFKRAKTRIVSNRLTGYGLGWSVSAPIADKQASMHAKASEEGDSKTLGSVRYAIDVGKDQTRESEESSLCQESTAIASTQVPTSRWQQQSVHCASRKNGLIGNDEEMYVYHTGAAIGASSVLLIRPRGSALYNLQKIVEVPDKQADALVASELESDDAKEVVKKSSDCSSVSQSVTLFENEKKNNRKKDHYRCVPLYISEEDEKESCHLCQSEAESASESIEKDGSEENNESQCSHDHEVPAGIVITIMTNHTGISLTSTAIEIAKLFEHVRLGCS